MKKLFSLIVLSLVVIISQAQGLNPVSWTFTSKKIDDKTFEIHMTASIQSGWHMYSQTQPDGAVAIPTSVTINANPLFTVAGAAKEVGKMQKFKDASTGIPAHQYSNKVDFVHVVKLKAKAKTNITGSVEFQTCDDQKCLPPKTVNFNIALK